MKYVLEITSDKRTIEDFGDHLTEMHRQLDIYKTAYRILQKEHDELLLKVEEDGFADLFKPLQETDWKEIQSEKPEPEYPKLKLKKAKQCFYCGAAHSLPVDDDSERALQERGGWRESVRAIPAAIQSNFAARISSAEVPSTNRLGFPL